MRTAAAALIGAVTLGPLTASPALAYTSASVPRSMPAGPLDLSSVSKLEAALDARGISAEAKQTILDAARTGQPLLADDPNATPVSTQNLTRGDFAVAVQTFADGSFIETGVERPVAAAAGSGVSPMSINGCVKSSVSGGTKYAGCQVYTWVGSISMSFYTTYTIVTNGNDKINSVSGQNISAPFYSLTGWSLSILRSTEGASGPALARYHTDLQGSISGIPFSTSRNLYLNVGGNTAWDTFG
jgi:hypothetical protein